METEWDQSIGELHERRPGRSCALAALTDLNFDNPSEKCRGERYRREPQFCAETNRAESDPESLQFRLKSKSNLRETECPR